MILAFSAKNRWKLPPLPSKLTVSRSYYKGTSQSWRWENSNVGTCLVLTRNRGPVKGAGGGSAFYYFGDESGVRHTPVDGSYVTPHDRIMQPREVSVHLRNSGPRGEGPGFAFLGTKEVGMGQY